MQGLYDGDIFLYELASCAHYKDEDDVEQLRDFDFVAGLIDRRIAEIREAIGATESPIFYFTGKGNFRIERAKTKPYKGTRTTEKPYHYGNVKVYLESCFECHTSLDCEADDELAMAQMVDVHRFSRDYEKYGVGAKSGLTQAEFLSRNCKTVICTRDKDLRMVPGWHYGWECGAQPEFALQWIDDLPGTLTPTYKTKEKRYKTEPFIREVTELDKLKGTGNLWFYAQMLMGDGVDNIPGCKGVGLKATYEALKDCTTEKEMYKVVIDLYISKHDEEWMNIFEEQADLLWMIRERDEEGNLVFWSAPNESK